MLTAAPLPRLGDLVAAAFAAAPADQALARPWRRGNEVALWFSRGAFALAALVRWARESGRSPTLWLPDYFCNQSSEPARGEGARIVFYLVGPDLAPKWDDCRALVGSAPPAFFVLVHHFGHVADVAAARRFCDATGARLIEDAAHALIPAGIGAGGDFVLWSPRKTLAIPDGGLLLCRDPAEAEALARAALTLGASAPPVGGWLAKRILQRLVPGLVQRPMHARRALPFEADPPFARLPRTPALSALGRRLIGRAAARLADADARRRLNEASLRRVFADVAGCRPLFARWPEDWPAPYRFVLACESEARAAQLYGRLVAGGCPAETWPDLAPEVTADSVRHADAIGLRRTLVLLPVHQTIAPAELAPCCL